ncbi:uncharacterized protein NEMAJ01_0877 [Nematocida major]|uniref:uncharacterized protein n=1 Tax=Nematocida major TaxID=1912982 RepID=UPI002007E5F3|nr:uncharacterized protein NEMAJ01_0877 [Nematocida major]KAH9385981.1 hypothetical protein NEMAJ01_0877 [Nematocida major]
MSRALYKTTQVLCALAFALHCTRCMNTSSIQEENTSMSRTTVSDGTTQKSSMQKTYMHKSSKTGRTEVVTEAQETISPASRQDSIFRLLEDRMDDLNQLKRTTLEVPMANPYTAVSSHVEIYEENTLKSTREQVIYLVHLLMSIDELRSELTRPKLLEKYLEQIRHAHQKHADTGTCTGNIVSHLCSAFKAFMAANGENGIKGECPVMDKDCMDSIDALAADIIEVHRSMVAEKMSLAYPIFDTIRLALMDFYQVIGSYFPSDQVKGRAISQELKCVWNKKEQMGKNPYTLFYACGITESMNSEGKVQRSKSVRKIGSGYQSMSLQFE